MMHLCWLLLIFGAYVASASEWSYSGEHGPANWAHMTGNEACGGTKQSPIDIAESATTLDQQLGSIVYNAYDDVPTSMTLVNNGHSAQVNLESDMWIEGGGLPARYKPTQFHFHWGSSNDRGSEHTIGGKRYPMEMHIVHYSLDYADMNTAMDKENGLAVLSFMFRVTEDDNPDLDELIDCLERIPYKGNTTPLKPFSLDSFLPQYRAGFARYSGSLTTPPCYESVVWTVFDESIPISEDQLEEFRELHAGEDDDTEEIVNNYRPIQSLNGRTIKRNMMRSTNYY